MTCLLFMFIGQAYASTPNVGGAGIDLIIIIACLSLLVGMVYLCKFLLEKYRIARKNPVWHQSTAEAIDDEKEIN